MITTNMFLEAPGKHYNIRNHIGFSVPFARTIYHGTESISYLGSKASAITPKELKEDQSLNSLKKSNKNMSTKQLPFQSFIKSL